MEITVRGSGKTETWNIPKALLRHHSGSLREACDGGKGERCKDQISIEVCPPSVFEIFVQWIYTGTFPDEKIDNDEKIWTGYVCWALGNELAATRFKNRAMLYIHQFSGLQDDFDDTAIDAVRWCWSNKDTEGALRRYFIDAFARYWVQTPDMKEVKNRWKELFDDCPGLSRELLFAVTELKFVGKIATTPKPLEEYLEEDGEDQ